MKRTVLFLAVALLATMALKAFPGMPINYEQTKQKNFAGFDNSVLFSVDKYKGLESTQAFSKSRNIMGLTHWGGGTHYTPEMTPIVWEPLSNSLFITNNPYVYVGQTRENIQVLYYRSTNMGSSWDTVVVFNEKEWGGIYPSIVVTNPKKSTNTNDLMISLFSDARDVKSENFPAKGGLVNYRDNDNQWQAEVMENIKNSPGSGYSFGNLRLLPYAPNSNESYFVGLGMLNRVSQNSRYGAYGVLSWDMMAPADKQTLVASVIQKINPDVFKLSDDINQSWNGPLNADFDDDGKLYVLVNNLYNGDTKGERIPGVITSTDLGATWSDIMKMPYSIITSFIESTGYTTGYSWDPYAMNAFIVTGPNEFSFVQKIVVGDPGTEEGTIRIQQMHIVEFYFRQGAWGFQQISQCTTPQVLFPSADPDIRPTVADSAIYLLNNSSLGNEIQLSKTADGSKIVLKWINPSINVVVNPPHVVSMINSQTDKQQLVTIDTFYTTDVYMCYRDAHQNNWSKTVNVTNDTTYDKATWIPRIIPNINNIPMIRNWTPFFSAPGYLVRMNRRIAEAIVGTLQFIEFGTMDATKDAEGPNSVEDNPRILSTSGTSVMPNPVSNECELIFNMVESGNVSIEVFNSLGQSQGVIYNALQTPGVHAISFDVSGYTPGAYYYTVTGGNHTQTGKFHVVK